VKELKTLILGTTAALVSASLAHAADGLNKGDADKIFQSCVTTANKTPSPIRGTPGTKMWCAVLDREGETLLIKATDTGESPGPHLLSDAWRASIEIAEAKAYTALSVSSNDAAIDSKTVGLLSRPDCNSGSGTQGCVGDLKQISTNAGPAPLWGVGNTNPFRPGVGDPSLHPDDKTAAKHHGIVTFAGGQPVYTCTKPRKLMGGVGVSGDGVDQDDAVAKGAVTDAGFCLTP
jgi:uncharacterized protein GlcG (DUF336 family)